MLLLSFFGVAVFVEENRGGGQPVYARLLFGGDDAQKIRLWYDVVVSSFSSIECAKN